MRFRTKRRDAHAIAFHYDVSNEFYELFLDRRMVYTCAYYRRPDGDLDQAQEDKLDLVCRKLDLRPGERLLDIGCGWGSLVLWATERYGVEARGVTLSQQQADWAQATIRRAGLADRARVDHMDYRDLPCDLRFDKVAAVGVIEHLGIRNYPAYFARVHELLRPGGRFLNHGITHEKHWRRSSETAFLERHVFPNAEIDNVTHILDVLEQARFEILDVESLRAHYARTTRQWVERLQANAERARALVSQRVYRTWLAYLAGASVGFTRGFLGLYQVVAARPDPARAEAVPETREGISARPVARRGLARAS
ncbi:MAG TPA: cyclopropane-fatty-acyl-phospholipid synthase family protein [Candidatus Binatia bacterium]|nr:cyclopropane-fatty-acyl-phospholipid synthase family protein [Candidatus Binatia bacterium]